jgi:hypothetical protein
VLRDGALIGECGLDPRGEEGQWLAELVAGVADEVAFAFGRRCERVEHRVEGPPEPGDFVVGLLGNLEPDAWVAGSPGSPLMICAAWPRQCSAGLRADRTSR